VVNAFELYSEGARFESQPEYLFSWKDVRGFPKSRQANSGILPGSRPRAFPLQPFQVHQHDDNDDDHHHYDYHVDGVRLRL
jgi:hypothetical protein